MNTNKAKKALTQIAREEGISVDAVRHEIELAINEARNNPDPDIQNYWKMIPCKGEFPIPEELITYIAGTIKKVMKA